MYSAEKWMQVVDRGGEQRFIFWRRWPRDGCGCLVIGLSHSEQTLGLFSPTACWTVNRKTRSEWWEHGTTFCFITLAFILLFTTAVWVRFLSILTALPAFGYLSAQRFWTWWVLMVTMKSILPPLLLHKVFLLRQVCGVLRKGYLRFRQTIAPLTLVFVFLYISRHKYDSCRRTDRQAGRQTGLLQWF